MMWILEDFFGLRIVAPLARQLNHPSVFQTSVKHELLCHSPSLRFGLCWYRIGLSDLAAPTERLYTGISYHRIPARYKEIVVPLARQLRQLLPAPTERHDTSIAQRAMSMIHPTSQGLKDRRIDARMTLSTGFTHSPF